VRGAESLTYSTATRNNIAVPVLGLGLSIGTGGAALTAELVVLANWDQLDGPNAQDVTGKVVLMNIPFTTCEIKPFFSGLFVRIQRVGWGQVASERVL
jgi:hypothetical protein